MQDFYLVLNWSVTIALLGLGTVALSRSHRLFLNQIFLLLTATLGVWIISSYISNDVHNSPRVSVIGNYFVFAFSFVAAYMLMWFSIILSENARALWLLKRTASLAVAVTLISGSPLVVAGAKRQGNVYALNFGPLVLVYFAALLSVLVVAMIVLRGGIRRSKGDKKAQLNSIYWSFAVALPVLLLTEFILPATTGLWELTNVGILIMALPVLALYYGAIRHRLFDVRLFAVRAVAYLLSLTLITLIYLLPVTYLASKMLDIEFTGNTFLTVTIAGIGFAVLYHYGRVWFDRLTKSIFYRGYYTPQMVLDMLSDLLVRTVDLDELEQGSGKIITRAIGTKLYDFWLHDGRTSEILLQSEKLFDISSSPNVVVLDELDDHTEIKRLLADKNVAALVRLRTTRGLLGVLVLGFKESGGAYSQQDKQMLGTAADEIAVGLQNALHFDEIQQFNETLQVRVTRATSQLRRTNTRLRELDSTKDDFISMASHQLRTPLTSVKGYLSMVLEGDAGSLNDQQRKLLEQSFRSSQQMVFLISDLLNLSRLNTGKFIIEASSVDLRGLVQFEVSQLTETANARGVTLLFDEPATFPTLMLDETKIHQVVMNFIDNAIYYTPSGGKVTVGLRETPTAVEYTVQDTGIGVPKNVQHKLFTKFYRADNAQKARPDGTGLGLFMAKKVILAQGGSIIFESQEGKGSTFGFRIPKVGHLATDSAAAREKAA